MGSGRWGLERSTEQAFMSTGKGEKEREAEDHVAGLVKQIAQAMLEEEEEEEEDNGGKRSQKSVWGSHSVVQASAGIWDKSGADSSGGLASAVHKTVESEAMELLYMELVRLKMEELAVAQRQLSLYQRSLVDSRQQTPYSAFTSTDGLSSSMFADPQQLAADSLFFQPFHGQTGGGGEWVTPNMMHCQNQSNKQRLESPSIYPNGRYPTRGVASLGAPTSRESGGTGVFLPRCRTGARHMRILESKRRAEYQCPVSMRCTKAVLPGKRKEDVDGPAIQYPAYSTMQEVAPDVSLPTEWTY